MNIAEAERRTGLSRANIRFYEKEGLLKPTRGENGYRDYSAGDLARLLRIKRLASLGFPLARIGDVLDEIDAGCRTPTTCGAARA